MVLKPLKVKLKSKRFFDLLNFACMDTAKLTSLKFSVTGAPQGLRFPWPGRKPASTEDHGVVPRRVAGVYEY